MLLLKEVECLRIESHHSFVNSGESEGLLPEMSKVDWNQNGCQKYKKEQVFDKVRHFVEHAAACSILKLV